MDQVHINGTGLLECIPDGILCDFMESDAVFSIFGQIKHLGQMPADGLSLTIGVGCQINIICFFRFFSEISHNICLILGNLIRRPEMIFNINTEAFFAFDGKVADMSFTGYNGIVRSQVFSDCLGLCR